MKAFQSALSDRHLLKGLWVLLGASMSLSAVDFFRLDLALPGNPLPAYNVVHGTPVYGSAHVSLSMFLVAVIVGWAGLMVLLRGGRLKLEGDGRSTRTALKLACGLLIWHLASVLWSPQTAVALRETSKIAVGSLIFALILVLMPRRLGVVERFWTAAVWGGAILCAWLMYRSAKYFTGDFLVLELDENSNFGRNQFAGTLAYLVPFAAAYAWAPRRHFWHYVPFATLGLALLYSASRGGTISTTFGLLTIVVSRARRTGWFTALRRSGVGMAVLVAVIAGVVTVTGYNTEALARRWAYLYDPASVPELHSYENRSLRVLLTLGIAAQKPITGWGIGSLMEEDLIGTLPHNDYLTMLAELGGVGEVLLLSILGFVAWRLFRPRRRGSDAPWVYLGSCGAFVAVTIFMLTMDRVYSTTAFWILLATMLVATEYGNQTDSPQAIRETAAR